MEIIGLTKEEVIASRAKFGSNTLTEKKRQGLLVKILLGFTDPMILILLFALAVQLALFFLGRADWQESFGVFLAIMVANLVSALSEHKQEGQANALKSETLARQRARVLRDGVLQEVPITEIVAGDVIFVQAGDKLPADGEVIFGKLMLDQATLNGETDEAEKLPADGEAYDTSDLLNHHYVYRGTVVCGGEGYIEIKVVGDKTLFGKLALEVQEAPRATPLQVKLARLAKQISIFGTVGAVTIVCAILGRTYFAGGARDLFGWVKVTLDAFTVAVTVIVCAVPEGLPMLTSLLLSLKSIKMSRDNVLVRKINGIETAGSTSLLFTDKTGTITEGKLSVVSLATGDRACFKSLSDVAPALQRDIAICIGLNNSAKANGATILGGNPTDRALMAFLALEGKLDTLFGTQILNFEPFDSSKKYSLLEVAEGSEVVQYTKGAAERVVEGCTHFVATSGEVLKLTEKEKIYDYLDKESSASMRLIGVAKRVGEMQILLCLVSIRDDVRPEARRAIKTVQRAGVQVVMVTGDRKQSAVAIARDAGLLTSDDQIALTSSEMAQMSDEELKAVLPRLRVVARALPTDKSRLVCIAQELDYVVGMTGDGVNDAPALKRADVGFAMGSGTEVAKEAGDITILDDNFCSIAKAILYGRAMFQSIRKFLIFQLTVNVAAVLVCFLAPLLGQNVVLTVVQLLIINMAMDTLAAIAFGSLKANESLMTQAPIPRSEGIITGRMLSQILFGATYITAICLAIIFAPSVSALFESTEPLYLRTALFATFMVSITCNGFNALADGLNPFSGIAENKIFAAVMCFVFALQFAFVSLGGAMFGVTPLTARGWGLCICLAILIIPLEIVRKIVMKIFKR